MRNKVFAKGMIRMQNNQGIWLPLIASVGVGAATYFTMTNNNSNIGQTVQQMVPIVASMAGHQSNQTNQANQTQQNQGTQSESGQLGPFGMS